MSWEKEENHDGGEKNSQPICEKKTLQAPEEVSMVPDAENVKSCEEGKHLVLLWI